MFFSNWQRPCKGPEVSQPLQPVWVGGSGHVSGERSQTPLLAPREHCIGQG